MGILLRSRAETAAAREAGAPAAGGGVIWARLGCAAGLLALIFAGAVFTDETSSIHPVMVHSFELVLGALLGLLTGESAHT